MIKLVGVLFTVIITSFYFFPFEFSFLPSVNTKMVLAGISLLVLGIQLGKKQQSEIDKDIFFLSGVAAVFSLITLISVVLNGTNDYTYVTYIVSMWVWMGGAYLTTQLIKSVHGHLSIELICNYLILVCVMQCLLAYSMVLIPSIKDFVDSFLGGSGFMGTNKTRMYGIGAALDVAGSRFSVILVMISYLSVQASSLKRNSEVWLYLMAFVIVSVIGNMMARTTTIGVCLSLLYIVYACFFSKNKNIIHGFLSKVILVFTIGVLMVCILYQVNAEFRSNIRFAFEGFFSLAEKGKWEVHSNEILEDMYVLPDNLRTWFIGDGYLENPYNKDPYYVGKTFGGYYMGTDVGYLRFIFYSGLISLLTFIFFMYRCAKVCIEKFESYKLLFGMILCINYIIWFKVSSDIFLVFALFLCLNRDEVESVDPHNYIEE